MSESAPDPARAVAPTPLLVGALVALGAVHGGWALFQWTQLIVARRGGESFCGLGGAQSLSCTAIWDSNFASAVQTGTGLPVAGWGVVWSLVAFALPLAVLIRQAGGQPATRGWAATQWTGIAALLALPVLLGVSLLQGHLCTTCSITYLLIFAYGLLCFVQTPLRGARILPGLPLALAGGVVAFLLMLYPGLHTPQSKVEQGRRVLDRLAREAAATPAPSSAEPTPATSEEPTSGEPTPAETPAEKTEVDARLQDLMSQMKPDVAQTLSDTLEAYREAPALPLRPPRALEGSKDAPVRLTTFTDSLCGHCAQLHETIEHLRAALPLRSFVLESRQFPLDPSCNPLLHGASTLPVRCLAARARICLEDKDEAFQFAGSLYRNQQSLTPELVYELARPLTSREALDACIQDPVTEAKLRNDIEWAEEYKIAGTPLVLLDGRQVLPFPPLLYALILTRGNPDHPAFDALPPPRPIANGPAEHEHEHEEIGAGSGDADAS